MSYELLATTIAVGSIVLMVVFGLAVQRLMIKARAETKEEQRRRALESIAAQNWQLPPDYKFDREEANERSRDTH